jgi:hypothetical protein
MRRKRDWRSGYELLQFQLADRALKRWAKYNDICPDSQPRCTLAEMVELGLHVPSGYTATSNYYPDVMQTQRIWAFMETESQRVVYMHYCYGGTKTYKASLIGITRNKFNRYLQKGIQFYIENQDIDFNKFFTP